MASTLTPNRARPGRRRFGALTAIVLAAILTLAGCSSDDDSSSGDTGSTGGLTGGATDTSSAGKQGGTLTYALDSPILSLDANVAAAAQDARILRQLYDSLVARKPDGSFVPWLAKSWKISDDGLTYTFTLRDDVKFQDGTTFDAEAVCFNFDRIADPKNGSIFAKGAIGPYKSCKAQDATTAVITMSQAYAPFLAYLSSPFLGMTSPTAVQKLGKDGFAAAPVGTGPFSFVSYTPNDKIVLKRNPDYNWAPETMGRQGPAYLDQLVFQFITDPTVRVGSLKNGDVQAIGNVPEAQVSQVQSDSKLKMYIKQQSGSPFQLHFNTSKPPLDDPAVRTALREALDVQSAVDSLYFGVYTRAWGPLSPTTQGYDPSVENSVKYDPDAAKAALDAAGWKVGSDGIRAKDGKKLTLVYVEGSTDREKRQELQTFFIKNWKDIGVEVTPQLNDTAAALSAQQNNKYDISGLSLVNPDPAALNNIYNSAYISQPGRSGYNLARVNDPDLDAALKKMIGTVADADRMAQVKTLQKTINDAAYSVPIYVPTYTVGTAANVTGLTFDNESYPIFYNVSLS